MSSQTASSTITSDADVITLSIHDAEKSRKKVIAAKDECERRLSIFLSTITPSLKRPRRTMSQSNVSSFSSEADVASTPTCASEPPSAKDRNKDVNEQDSKERGPALRRQETSIAGFGCSDSDTDCVDDEDCLRIAGCELLQTEKRQNDETYG
jgi:hypothetical protein